MAYQQRARQQLRPKFEEQLAQLAMQQQGRGFYGQAAGDAATQSTRVQQIGQQSQLANQLQQQDRSYGLQRDQFDFQQDRWEDEYGLQRDQFDWQQDRWEDEFDLQQEQFETQQDQYETQKGRQKSQDMFGNIGTGAAIGSTFGPVGSVIGGGLGALTSSLFG